MTARTLAAGLIVLLAGLIVAWQAVLSPPDRLPRALAAALHLAPLLPALVLLLLRHRAATFWGAVAALLLFCHGVSEAWAEPAARALAGAEIVLSVLLVFAASWDGLRARVARRRGV